MKLVYQYKAIFISFSHTLSHLHPLQVENCDSNYRLVVDEDDNGKFRPERTLRVNELINFHLDVAIHVLLSIIFLNMLCQGVLQFWTYFSALSVKGLSLKG